MRFFSNKGKPTLFGQKHELSPPVPEKKGKEGREGTKVH